nr:hypothetical protein [Tanacetum cinerariifolium]
MAQQVIPAAHLFPRYHTIGRCNNYAMLQSIPCFPECKIRTVSKVHGPEETIKFMLNTQEFVYTLDMFQDILDLPVETLDNPFVAPVNIETVETFMIRVGYQGVVDKVSAFYKESSSTMANNVQVSVYTTGDMRVRGMLILDEFLTKEICATDDQKEYEMMLVQLKVVERDHDDDDDSEDRLEPESHKDNPEHVDDDDVKNDDKVDEEEGDEMEASDLVSQEFNAQEPKIIEELFKNYIKSNVVHVHPTTPTSTETTSSPDLQQQLYFKMKGSLQDQVNDPTLWEVLKHKFENSSTSDSSCRDDDIHSQRHDDHQEDDGPFEWGKE